ncbi:DUF1853 family protein [Enterovibrio sp. 27052020O]|uniref:DUF1853 family protein n=1 Tax=Enterovibrio sp. 27052020O TaxID=3241166 RepID=UPI0038911862
MFADKAQVTRDMEWIVSTQTIVQLPDIYQFDQQFWQGVPKENWPGYDGGQRIGFYYQWLIKQCINSHPSYQLVAEEIQVNKDGRTLGAVDFIVENPQGELEHWEVAVKFYLAFHSDWHGPNAKDTLAKKYQKMTKQQLLLSDTKEYLTQFPQYPISHRKLLMQGRLYTNPFLPQHQVATPSVTQNAVCGYWCWPHQIPKDKDFHQLHRHQWMQVPSLSELTPFVLETPLTRAQHVIDEEGIHWFIVPESWPAPH